MMGRRSCLPLALALGLFLVGGLAPAQAQEAGWCLQCHRLGGLESSGAPLGQLAWQGPLGQEALRPCPALGRARREIMAAEGRLSALSALLPGLERDRLLTSSLEQGLVRAGELHRQALGQPVTSLEEISAALGAAQGLAQELVEAPLREQEARRARAMAWGLIFMAACAAGLAWLKGLRRRHTPHAGEAPLAQVREGRLP